LPDLETDPSLRIVRSGDSQSLTPFASQQWQASSEVGELGGLVLPSSSSPIATTTFKLPGADDVIDSSGFSGVDNRFQLDEDPGFTFNDNGELELTEPKPAPKTPRAVSRAPMMLDAATELTVREQQAEVLDDGTQVSFTMFS
jgi:meiotic recombination protein REC8, fungi type